jgi:hypothetical protein
MYNYEILKCSLQMQKQLRLSVWSQAGPHQYFIGLAPFGQFGHRIRLRNERPGFESRQGIRCLGKHSSAVVYKMTS